MDDKQMDEEESDEPTIEYLQGELAKAKRERDEAAKNLFQAFNDIVPDNPDLVLDTILEVASDSSELKNPERHSIEALRFWREGDRKTALYLYNKAVEAFPGDGAVLLNRGNLQIEMGNFDAGINDLEKAHSIDPELPWQNAVIFKMLSPEEREATRQRMLAKKVNNSQQ